MDVTRTFHKPIIGDIVRFLANGFVKQEVFILKIFLKIFGEENSSALIKYSYYIIFYILTILLQIMHKINSFIKKICL